MSCMKNNLNLLCITTHEKYEARICYLSRSSDEYIFNLEISEARHGDGIFDFGRRHTPVYLINFKTADQDFIISNIRYTLPQFDFSLKQIEIFIDCFKNEYKHIYK